MFVTKFLAVEFEVTLYNSARKKMNFLRNFQWPINRPKTLAAEAEDRLLKSFEIDRLRSALVILCCVVVQVANFFHELLKNFMAP